MPHTHSFQPGDIVICDYRLPCPRQHWLGEIKVGVVIEPGDDPAAWNGRNSERSYCELCGKLPIRYSWGIMHDSVCNLRRLHDPRTRRWLQDQFGAHLDQIPLDMPVCARS